MHICIHSCTYTYVFTHFLRIYTFFLLLQCIAVSRSVLQCFAMCRSMYIHPRIYIFLHVHTCTCTVARLRAYTSISAHIHAYIHTNICMYICLHIYKYTHAHVYDTCACISVRLRSGGGAPHAAVKWKSGITWCTCTCTCIYVNMCVYIYMNICVWIYLQVRGFAAGGPAERSGKIEVGHILVQVDGTTVRGLQYPELAQVRVGFQNVFCMLAQGIACIFAHPTYTCLQYPDLAGSCRVS